MKKEEPVLPFLGETLSKRTGFLGHHYQGNREGEG